MFPTIRKTAARLTSAPFVRAVLPLWVMTLGLEMFVLSALEPSGFFDLMLEPSVSASQVISAVTASLSVKQIITLVILLIAVGAFQHGLYRPMRAIVIERKPLSLKHAAQQALLRTLPAFFCFEIVNILVTIVALLCITLGAQVAHVPQLIAYFVLFPAVYITVARRRGILNALGCAVSWSRNFRYMFWILGVQTLVVGFALLLRSVTGTVPELTETAGFSVAAASIYGLYRFVQWISISLVLLAVDADDAKSAA